MSSPESPRSRRRLLIWVSLAAVLLAAAGAGAYVLLSGGDVSNPDVEFRAEPTETPAPTPAKAGKDDFTWAHYGYSKDRRQYLAASKSVRPPFKRRWSWGAKSLLEFTPVIGEGKLFVIKNNGAVYAISKRTGKPRWGRDLGKLAASAPAYAGGRIYVTILRRDGGSKNGLVAALRAKDGARLWTKPLPSRTESSPLVDGGRVYFGSEDGTVYALRARDGSVVWRFKASGAVKGAPALADGKLYFGDYSGRMYAIRESNGKRVWSRSTRGARFGTGSGQFYATPAVAYGRVYIGNTDSNVYSFSASSGKLAWRTGTGGYVYASAAIAQVPGGKPTVYVGSYDSRFYALDAKSGKVRWKYKAPGRISGAATVVGDIVYFGDLHSRTTTGLGARTGRKVFKFSRGGFNPVVSDGRNLYVVGYASLSQLTPKAPGR
jgi:outer membrane protein assembly factor BamB